MSWPSKIAYDLTGVVHEIEWHWHHESGDWWPEIEEIDGKSVKELDLTDEQISNIQQACAEEYPLSEYESDRAGDWY